MGERENQTVVERLIGCINDRRIEVMDELFHEDAVMDWPQSGERIVGGDSRRGVYGAFPQLPTITPRRLLAAGDLVVAEASLDYGGGPPPSSSSSSGTARSPARRPTGPNRSRRRSGAAHGCNWRRPRTPERGSGRAPRPETQNAPTARAAVGASVDNGRRWRDLNPRWAINPNPLSSRASGRFDTSGHGRDKVVRDTRVSRGRTRRRANETRTETRRGRSVRFGRTLGNRARDVGRCCGGLSAPAPDVLGESLGHGPTSSTYGSLVGCCA